MITVHTNKKAPAHIANKDLEVGNLYKFTYSGSFGKPSYYIGMVVHTSKETRKGIVSNIKSMLVLDVVGSSDVVGNVFEIPAASCGFHELFDGSITLENK